MFFLAKELGFTVQYLLNNMSAAEFTMWLAYYRIEAREREHRAAHAAKPSKTPRRARRG